MSGFDETFDGFAVGGIYAYGVPSASTKGGVDQNADANSGRSLTFSYIAAKHAAGLGTPLG